MGIGLPKYVLDYLHRVMNAAARMLCGAGKYSHVTGLIHDRLHWLPVAQRIQFKLCLMYKAMHGLAPAYLSEICTSSCIEGRTRSSARSNLVVQRTRTKFGGRAFVVAGPAGGMEPVAVLRSQLSVLGQRVEIGRAHV